MAIFSDNARRQARMQAELNKLINSESVQKKIDQRKFPRQHVERDLFLEQKENLNFFKDIGDEADADIIKDLDNSVWLYRKNRKYWREKHASELNWRLQKVAQQENYNIAPVLAYRMANLAQPQGAHVIVPHAAVNKYSDFPKLDEQLVELYSGLNVRTFSQAFPYNKSRKTADRDFIYQKTAPFTKGAPYESVRAVKNIIAQGGRAVAYDSETFGRLSDDNYNKMQRMTEFSFTDGYGDFKTGEFKAKKTYGSIIGLSDKEHKDMLKLIDRYSRGEALTAGEKVTLQRLALHGGKYTHVNWDEAKDGVVRFSSFSEQKDITGKYGKIEEMIKGANLLRKVGEYQEKSRVGNDMFGWEKELLAAFRNIHDNNLTAVNFNGNRFDNPQFDYLFHNMDMTSEAFRKEISKLNNGGHLHLENSLDAFLLPKARIKDPYGFWRKYMGGDVDKTRALMRWINENEEHPRTQQTILAALAIKKGVSPESIHSGQTHIAEADAIDLMRMVFDSEFFDPESSNTFIDKQASANKIKLKGNGTQLFFAHNSSWNPHKHGIMSFSFDGETNQWWSSDGIAVGEEGAQALYQAPGVRRRALYELTGINKIETDSPLMKIFSKKENMAGGDLYAFRFTPHSNSRMKAASRDVVWVGTYEDLMSAMDSMFTLAGTKKNSNEKYFTMDGVPKAYKDVLKMVTADANGNRKVEKATLEALTEMSTRAFNDAAGRKAREKNLYNDSRLMQYIKDMDKYVIDKLKKKGLTWQQAGKDAVEELRQEFRDNVRAKTEEISLKQRKGIEVKFNEYDGSLQDYFGYIDPNTGQRRAYADSMDNMAALEQWGRDNRGLIEASITAVQDKYGSDILSADNQKDKDKAQFFYREVREMLEDRATQKVGKSGAGYKPLPRVISEMNRFQVDVEGFYGIKSLSGSTVVSIDIDDDYGVVKSLMQQMGRSEEQIENTSKDEKLALLDNFQQLLLDQDAIRLSDLDPEYAQEYLINRDEDSVDIAGGKITRMMRERRKHSVLAGVLSPTEQFDIINNLKNGGLTDDEILDVKSQALKTVDFEIAESFKPVEKNGKITWDKDSAQGKKFFSWVKDVAFDINKDIVFNNGFDVWEGSEKEEAEFIKKLQETAGYSERDARKVYKMQRVRFGASQEMLEKIIGGIYTHGGAVGYNPRSGQFWIFNDAARDIKANNYTVISLDRNVFTNGAFRRRLSNGQEFSDEIGLYHSSKENGLIFSTEEGRFAHDSDNLIGAMFKRGKDNGNLAEQVLSIFGMRSKRYRRYSADYSGDLADRSLANVMNIDEVPHDLGRTHIDDMLKELKELDGQPAEIMTKYLQEVKDNGIPKTWRVEEVNTFSKAGMAEAASMMRLMHVFAPYIIDDIALGRGEFLDFFEGDTTGAFQEFKSRSGDTRGQIVVLEDGDRGLSSHSKDLNHAMEKANKSVPFNVERAAEIMRGRGIRFGAAFESMQEHMHMNAISEKLGYDMADTMVVNKLSADSENMRKLMDFAGRKLGEDSYEYKQMMSILTDEASGAISAHLADAGASVEFFEQHVQLGKVLRSDIENDSRFWKLLKVQGNITFDDQGKAHYESGSGEYIDRDELLFSKASTSPNQKDTVIRSRQEGLLKFGVFKNGKRLTDEAVSDYINENIDQSLTGAERELAAWNLLSKENSPVSLDYYVKSMDIDGNSKMMDYSEKQVGHVLMNGVGMGSAAVDEDIALTLRDLGAERMIGRQIHIDFIQELMDKGSVRGTDFEALVRGLALNRAEIKKDENARRLLQKKLEDGAWIEQIINSRFGNVRAFASAVLEERYRTDTAMHEGLASIGINEIIDVFGHTAAGRYKHGPLDVFDTTFNGLVDIKGYTVEEAKDILEKSGAVKGLVVHQDKNGKKWVEFTGKERDLNPEALEKVTAEYFAGEDGWHDSVRKLTTDLGDEVTYEVARSQVRAIPNVNYGKFGKGATFRADIRTVDALESTVYTQKYLDKATEAIFGTFGDTAFARGIDEFTRTKKDGDLVYGELLNYFRSKTYNHDDMGTQGYERMVEWGERADSYDEGMDWLKEQGLTEDAAKHTLNVMKKNGYKEITANKVLDLADGISFAYAHEYNRSHRYSLDEMGRLGFKTISIDKLRVNANNHKTDSMFEDSLYGQAIVLDLHSQNLTEGQIYKTEKEQKIAIPFKALQQEDKTGAMRRNDVQRDVANFVRKFDTYVSEYEQHRNDGSVNADRRQELITLRDDIVKQISRSDSNKTGALPKASEAVISDGAMYATSQGFKFLGDGLDGAFGEMQFLDSGMNFTQLADVRNARNAVKKGSGMDVGYLFASSQHRDVIYSDEVFQRIAGGDSDFAAILKRKTLDVLDKEGTIAVDQRYPIVSLDAVQAVNMHFSPILGRDEVRTNLETWKQQNGDDDGDKLNGMIQRSKAKIKYLDKNLDWRETNSEIDYATYRALQQMDGVSVELADNQFEEAKAAMVRNGIDVTPYGQPQPSHWGKGKGFIQDDAYGASNLLEQTYNGSQLVDYKRKYSNEDRKHYKALLDQLHQNYKVELPEDYEKLWKKTEDGTAVVKDELTYVQHMGSFVAQRYGEEEAKAFNEALHFRKWEMGKNEQYNEAASKKAAGKMNKSLFELSRILHAKAEISGVETLEALLGGMALQEGTLTGKSTHGEVDLKRAERLTEVWQDALKAMYTGENREEAAVAFEDFVRGVFRDRAEKEFGNRAAMLSDDLHNHDPQKLIEDTTKMLGNVIRNTTIDRHEQKRLMIGVSKTGLNPEDPLYYSSQRASISMIDSTLKMANDMADEVGISAKPVMDIDDTVSAAIDENAKKASQQMAQAAAKNRNARYRRAAVQETAESAGKSFGRMLDIAPIGGSGGKAIAAAIGIAAGLMTAGYASGPSVKHDVPAPAQTQAMQMSNDQGDQVAMQQMSLSDSNLNVMRGGPSSGYVININAQTGQGQQAAVDAISNAASGLTPQTGSVNVNLSTSVGNSLSQLQVNRMVAHAIGVA